MLGILSCLLHLGTYSQGPYIIAEMSGEEVSLVKDSVAEKKSSQPHTPPIVATIPTISKPCSDEEDGPVVYVSQQAPWPKKSGSEKVNPALASPLTSRRIPNRSTIPSIDIISNNHNAIDDDDVFATNKTNEHKEDKKLVDWVTNVFVPACKNLLEQCSVEPVVITKVQTYLRLLNNTIMFFCNEHQQSPVVSPSRSMSGKGSGYSFAIFSVISVMLCYNLYCVYSVYPSCL